MLAGLNQFLLEGHLVGVTGEPAAAGVIGKVLANHGKLDVIASCRQTAVLNNKQLQDVPLNGPRLLQQRTAERLQPQRGR